jgi:membrane-associated protease RseP (regulator of RpoE activity)
MAEHLRQRPDALVVGILGSGHVRHGHGVAHQLKDLGIDRIGALLTWDHQAACSKQAGVADAIYVTRPPAAKPPRMGIAMQGDDKGVRIAEVVKNSVAEQAGLRAGDVLVEIAGRPAKVARDVRGAVQRQAPGTWLPIKIKRGGQELEIVVRFPVDS